MLAVPNKSSCYCKRLRMLNWSHTLTSEGCCTKFFAAAPNRRKILLLPPFPSGWQTLSSFPTAAVALSLCSSTKDVGRGGERERGIPCMPNGSEEEGGDLNRSDTHPL